MNRIWLTMIIVGIAGNIVLVVLTWSEYSKLDALLERGEMQIEHLSESNSAEDGS